MRRGVFAGVTVVMTVLACPRAWAQRDTSSILGTVRDSSGGVLPDASVTATNVATGIFTKAKTDSSGDYVVTPLRVGTYTLKAAANGMASQVFAGVILDLDQHLRVDFSLQAGSLQQQVTVTGAPPMLEVQSATVGQVIGGRQMENLPLVGRNFQGLSALVPGAVPSSAHSRDSGVVSLGSASLVEPA